MTSQWLSSLGRAGTAIPGGLPACHQHSPPTQASLLASAWAPSCRFALPQVLRDLLGGFRSKQGWEELGEPWGFHGGSRGSLATLLGPLFCLLYSQLQCSH